MTSKTPRSALRKFLIEAGTATVVGLLTAAVVLAVLALFR